MNITGCPSVRSGVVSVREQFHLRPSSKVTPHPPYSAIPLESPANVQNSALSPQEALEVPSEKSPSTTLGLLGSFPAVGTDSVVAPGTGATANLACFKSLGRRKSARGALEVPPAQPYPAQTRFKFGNGRMSKARLAAEIPATLWNRWRAWHLYGNLGLVDRIWRGGRGISIEYGVCISISWHMLVEYGLVKIPATLWNRWRARHLFLIDMKIPALSRKGATEPLGGQLDVPRKT